LSTVIIFAASPARADILGFNSGAGWTANNNGNTSLPAFSGNSVQMTNSNLFAATSVWFNTPQNIASGFTASFTYQAVGALGPVGQADGVTFALQNTGAGPTALGAAGGGLGYGGLAPSAAVEFNVYSPNGVGTTFHTNGAVSGYTPTGSVNIASGDVIQVVLTYNRIAGQLIQSLTDTSTTASDSRTYSVGDLVSVLGTSTPFVGFTGGTGLGSTNQTLTNFNLRTSVPEIDPAAIWVAFLPF
jgi:hypothetical protein